MSIPAARNLATRTDSHFSFCLTPTHFKTPNFSPSLPSKTLLNPPKLQILRTHLPSFTNSVPLRQTNKVWSARELEQHGTVQTQESSIERSSFDSFLSVAEFLCLASSAATSIGFAVNSAFSRSHKPVFGWLGNRFLAWQCVLLVGGVVIGAVIRSRQWRRLCRGVSRSDGCSGVNFLERIEKLEEDLRSSATIIRVLSRQLEKLGIRFRVTSKALKEPIVETAILAQKNSEATRALAAQEDILEKELCEIQKVLLAMQEQQQKQLELILAIGETGKLWESRRAPSQDQKTVDVSNSAAEGAKMMDINQIRTIARRMESSNEKL